MKKISFIIPCYGSEKTIAEVVAEIKATIRTREGYDYEIVLVADASPDNVYEVIYKLALEDKKIKGINLAKNFGQHSALMTGFNIATGDIMVILDDDGQTPANEMFILIDEIEKGSDLVFAKYYKKKHNIFRNMGSKLNDLMASSLIGKPKGLSIMSYFACKKFVIDEAVKYKNSYPYIYGLLLRSTNKVSNVLIHHREREEGGSTYTFKKLVSLWMNGFTAFSVKPLRIATFSGMAVALIGFIFAMYVIVEKIIHPDQPIGYPSLMAALLFIGGVLMLMLGIIGEYIGRIYITLNNSPQYVVREAINVEEYNE